MPDKYHRLISFLILFCCCFLFIPVSAQTNGPENPDGNLEMSVEGNILVNETELIGLEIIDDSIHSSQAKSAENVHEANIEVRGDLTGSLKGFVFDIAGSSTFLYNKEHTNYILAFLASEVAFEMLLVANPTINFQAGNIRNLPIIIDEKKKDIVNETTALNISISKKDWDSFETSWDFKKHPLI